MWRVRSSLLDNFHWVWGGRDLGGLTVYGTSLETRRVMYMVPHKQFLQHGKQPFIIVLIVI